MNSITAITQLRERAAGKFVRTGVTNELTRALNRLQPSLTMGQVETPPPWPGLPPGGLRYQVLQRIDDNETAGWDWPRVHDGTVGPPVTPDSTGSGS